jgi:hypothetical protein
VNLKIIISYWYVNFNTFQAPSLLFIKSLDQYDKLNNEMREMQIKYYEMKQKYDDMNDKMQFLSKVI